MIHDMIVNPLIVSHAIKLLMGPLIYCCINFLSFINLRTTIKIIGNNKVFKACDTTITSIIGNFGNNTNIELKIRQNIIME